MLGLLGAAAVGFYKRSSRSAAELLLPTVQVAYKVKKRNPDKGVEVYYKFLKKTQATGLGPGGLTSRYWYKWDKLPEDWSGNTLPHPIPEHDIEPGLPTLTARIRVGSGGTHCKKLGWVGRLAACVYSVPQPAGAQHWQATLNIHLDAHEANLLVRRHGRNGLQAVPLQLNIVDGADRPLRCVRVLAKEVQVNAVSLKLEHISFMLCPRDRVVRVLLPIKTTNEELNPNRKSGAFAYVTMRRVLYACLGSSVPPHIEVDVSKLALGEVVRVRDLPQPPGTKILHHWPDDGVVKCISATASAE